MRQATKPIDKNKCVWEEDADGNWNSACGKHWVFAEWVSPKESGMNYCPVCGQELGEKRRLRRRGSDEDR